jgi:tetratricopeptide (TPR) repeat protein
MKEANSTLEAGDTAGALPLFLTIVCEEPDNYDAPLTLARLYYKKGKHGDAAVMYDRAFVTILRTHDAHLIDATYEEIEEKDLVRALSEKNVYNYAVFLEKQANFEKAAKMYGCYATLFPGGKVRAKAIYRTYLLFRDKLHDTAMASSALAYLRKEHPEYPVESL